VDYGLSPANDTGVMTHLKPLFLMTFLQSANSDAG
jgi:hypothetical protein